MRMGVGCDLKLRCWCQAVRQSVWNQPGIKDLPAESGVCPDENWPLKAQFAVQAQQVRHHRGKGGSVGTASTWRLATGLVVWVGHCL